jgi:chemotaxis protein methyltransferase CheR
MAHSPLRDTETQNLQAFDALCAYLRRASGLILDAEKRYLVESRVAPIVIRRGFSGLAELVRAIERGQAEVGREVVQAMTINETYFFRDKLPFEKLRDPILPGLIEARRQQRALRIWCAASSSGQEPYSIAMILEDLAPRLPDWRIEVLATDLSDAVLAKAQAGIYSQFEVQRGLSTAQLLRFFAQVGEEWQINASVRSRVTFRPFNLLDDYTPLGRFDIIFCRNVLIYFDPPRKADVLNRMLRILAPDGIIALGASESVLGLATTLVPHPEHRGFFHHGSAASAGLQLRLG